MAKPSILRRLRRVGRMSSAERTASLEAFALVGALRVGLKVAPARFSGGLVNWLSSQPQLATGGDKTQTIEMVGRSLRRTEIWLGGSCLHRAVAGWFMLRKRSIGSQLRLGAKIVDNGIAAHAWLECEGRVVTGAETLDEHVALS